jgi:hypothetical protein
VLVRAIADDGAVTQIDDWHGLPVPIHRGDRFIGVLGTRRSGTKVSCCVPASLAAGDRLDLVAIGGLVGRATAVPRPYGAGRAQPLELEGFFRHRSGEIANVAHARSVQPSDLLQGVDGSRMLFIAGTSAEAGKTTFTCNVNLSLKRQQPEIRTAAIKSCGTGRLKDCQNYLGANYDLSLDFVDAGWATTYRIDSHTYRSMLTGLLNHAFERADFVVVEIGGDFLDGMAPDTLAMMKELGAPCAVLVNDAMGGLEAVRRLAELGTRPIAVSSFSQNLLSLAERLQVPLANVFDSRDTAAMDRLVSTLVSDPVRLAA